MSRRYDEQIPEELQPIVERLRDEKPEPTPVDLDELKLRAMRQASRQAPGHGPMRRLRSNLVTAMLVFGLMVGGTGGALAVKGGGGKNPPPSAAKSQYGGKKCGHSPGTRHTGGKPPPKPAPGRPGETCPGTAGPKR